MDENLVGYLLNALDPDAHEQVEAYLQNNAEAQRRLAVLRRALEPLACDRGPIAPAPTLVFETLAKVAEYRCRPLPEVPPLPLALPTAAAAPDRRLWGWPDMLVAASILLVVGLLGILGVAHVRSADQGKLACINNLRNFHLALSQYAQRHDGDYPAIPQEAPYNVAGMFVPQLRDSGDLQPGTSVRCPSKGDRPPPEYGSADLERMPPEQRTQALKDIAGCYAYSLGYRGPTGQYQQLRRDLHNPDLNDERTPIMADKPDVLASGARGNSRNHRGGQNILYLGGNVSYQRTPHAGIDDDNIYMNKEGKVAAGRDRWDTVLGTSADQP